MEGDSFGSKSTPYIGKSDGYEGVQWNIWENKDTEIWLGVNLEGKKYNNWPIADFIINELKKSYLIDIARNIKDPSRILVGLHRDAWQHGSRLPIKESNIGDGEIKLVDLTEPKWHDMLIEALYCLNGEKDYRGRARQIVTLTSDETKEMEVSPHLNIHAQVDVVKITPLSDVKVSVKTCINLLMPFYQYVNDCISGD